MDQKDNAAKGIINVIDEFDYSTQNEAYNENFREWRKRKGNIYAFSFHKNQRERIYIDGRGFVEKSCENAEKRTLFNIFQTLGYATLMYIVVENVLSKLIIYLLEFLGVDIHTSFSSSTIYGGCHEIAIALIMTDVIKLILPIIYLHYKFRVPKNVEIMGNMNNPQALVGTMATAFIVSVISSIPSTYSSEANEAILFFGMEQTDISIWTQNEFLVYTIFDVIIIPIISQILYCGAAFAVLRQFGDVFAMLVTALIAAVMTQDFGVMPVIFVITLVGCCGMLATGSLFTPIAVNIIFKMYRMTLALIETDTSDNMPIIRSLFMAVIVLIGTIGLIYFRFYLKKNKIRLSHYKSELSFRNRFIHSVKIFPFSAVLLICIIYAATEVML